MSQLSRIFSWFTLFCFSAGVVLAREETVNEKNFRCSITKAGEPVKIDGLLNEAAWNQSAIISNFKQSFPFDTSYALSKTEVRILHDDKFLYVSAVCYEPGKYTVQTLRRDFADGSGDLFLVTIDPFRDNLNTFYFSVSPYNVQKEGLISNGTTLNIDWDTQPPPFKKVG
ncbi:MAG: carbohydrate binding family 9 domain-containing protein [Chitinophagaceae bacterium]|nr:carbohydrate binding family 9 domain-containing protein [Chitinophagaceae bacterium]